MTDQTPETPRERALKDITAVIVPPEEIGDTLAGEPLTEALEIRGRLERLKEAVEGA